MTGCEIGLGKSFDLGICLRSMTAGWVPDWVLWLLPYWPWLIVIGGLGLVYRLAGWPGVVSFVFGLGFLIGRKSTDKPKAVEPDYETGEPPRPERPKKRKTLF